MSGLALLSLSCAHCIRVCNQMPHMLVARVMRSVHCIAELLSQALTRLPAQLTEFADRSLIFFDGRTDLVHAWSLRNMCWRDRLVFANSVTLCRTSWPVGRARPSPRPSAFQTLQLAVAGAAGDLPRTLAGSL